MRNPEQTKMRRRAAVASLSLALAFGSSVVATSASAQSAGAGDSLRIGVLFDSDTLIELRIAVDLRALVNDRDSLERKEHPAALTYRVGEGGPVSLDVDAKTRGHWRRQRANCDFPPLRLDFPAREVAGTIFAGQDKLKLVTPCRPGRREYQEYVLREYAAYRVYNLLTPLSFRVRLASTTYVDTAGREDSLTRYTFLVEDEDRMAARNDGRTIQTPGANFVDMDPIQLGLVSVFLYMIGGTDWSLRGLHNMAVVQEQVGTFYPVTYDFDWTGIANTSYATPDPRLGIRTVRERLYRGNCLGESDLAAVLAKFRERQADIYAVYDSVPGLSERYVKDTRAYLDAFYRIIDDPRKVKSELIRRCSSAERT